MQIALKLRRVDASEFVGADGRVPQVGCEDGLGQAVFDVVEKGLLLQGLDGVDGAKGQADQAV